MIFIMLKCIPLPRACIIKICGILVYLFFVLIHLYLLFEAEQYSCTTIPFTGLAAWLFKQCDKSWASLGHGALVLYIINQALLGILPFKLMQLKASILEGPCADWTGEDGKSKKRTLEDANHVVFICLDRPLVSISHLFEWRVMVRFACLDSSTRIPANVLLICSADTLLRTFSVSSSGRRALVFFSCSLSGFGVRTMLASWNESESSHLWVLLQEKDCLFFFFQEFEKDWQLLFAQLSFPGRLSSSGLFFGEGFSSLIESSCWYWCVPVGCFFTMQSW